MAKICKRVLNFCQISTNRGDVRLCGWLRDGYIGNIVKDEFENVWKSEKAQIIREKLANGDYSNCDIDACPYLAENNIGDALIDYKEIPDLPEELHLGYENVCNYACKSCTIHSQMVVDNENKDIIERNYRIIEEKIRPFLSQIRLIGTNGCGEIFVSKHIIALLKTWKPTRKEKEIGVILETNGSLFDEKHWKELDFLGKYNLQVHITIMSFEEKIYQELSGTRLGIKTIEKNLLFVKSLREKGIINYLELATVYQERNFRFLPDFARRCVDEFGADYVRLRPYEPWGSMDPEYEWFSDVRGKYHPYNHEFKDVMKDPIFKHPKVHDWGGGIDSNIGILPQKAMLEAERKKFKVLFNIIHNKKTFENRIKTVFDSGRFNVFGYSEVTESLMTIDFVSDNIETIIDRRANDINRIKVKTLSNLSEPEKQLPLLLTTMRGNDIIINQIRFFDYKGEIIELSSII